MNRSEGSIQGGMDWALGISRMMILGTLVLNYADIFSDVLLAIQWAEAKEPIRCALTITFILLAPIILGIIIPVKVIFSPPNADKNNVRVVNFFDFSTQCLIWTTMCWCRKG